MFDNLDEVIHAPLAEGISYGIEGLQEDDHVKIRLHPATKKPIVGSNLVDALIELREWGIRPLGLFYIQGITTPISVN